MRRDKRINWEQEIRKYAESTGEKYGVVIKWLSERDSLETIAGIVGELDTDDRQVQATVLRSLGYFLDKRGLTVPRMWCQADNYTLGTMGANGHTSNSTNDVTKEMYLNLRLSGVSRTDASLKLGVNPGTFYNLLERWGIKDKRVEAQLLERIANGQSSIESEASSVVVEASETMPEYQRKVTLSVTITEALIKESINTLMEAAEGWQPTLPVDTTLAGAIWASMARARQCGEDVATELVKRLREVAG